MVTLQTAENALKTVYLGVISNQINTYSDIVFSKIKQTTVDVWGKEIRKLVPYVDKNGEYIQLVSELKTWMSKIELSDKAIRASQTHVGAFVNLLNAECENLIKNVSIDIKDQLYNKDRNINNTLPNGDIEELVDKKITGISEIFDTSKETIYGCKRAEISQLNPTIQTAKEFNKMSIIEAMDNMEQKDSNINIIICSYATKRKLQEETNETMDYINGQRLVAIDNVPVVPNKYIEDDEIYLLNTNDFTLHQLCDWQWLEGEDGKVIRQNYKGIYEAHIVKYANLICDDISNQCLLKLEKGV